MIINAVKLDCLIEISYIDPETYTAIVNHDLRKRILKALYGLTLYGPISKQQLADNLGVGYHQLVYQLNNHLRDFWCVTEERKVRGTRMELIRPSNRHAVYITLGRGKCIHIVDPMANLFGHLSEVGTRCDTCTKEEAEVCMSFLRKNPQFDFDVDDAQRDLLEVNNRSEPFRPLDIALLSALRGIARDEEYVISIPCEGCAFLKRTIRIEGLE